MKRIELLTGFILLVTAGIGAASPAPGTAKATPGAKAKSAGKMGKAGIQWVSIPGGTFSMGTGTGDEGPAHQVYVEGFQMAKTEVTVEQYKACVDAGACTAPGMDGYCNWGAAGKENHPVNCVDWSQAKAFAEWAGGRLPSEGEWEYAARSAGKDREYPWGNEDATCKRAVISDGGDGCGKDSTWPVCSKPQGNSEQGLCDLAGNVWEWVQDWYHDSYNGAPTDGVAWESPTGSVRVLRGGSWYDGASFTRAALRYYAVPGISGSDIGLRPVRSGR